MSDGAPAVLREVPAQRAVSQALLTLRFSAAAAHLKPMRAQVREASLARGWPDKLVGELVIAINEACMNIIEHAYRRDSAGEIVLEMHDNEIEVEIVLTDFAAPIDLNGIQGRALDDVRPGGLGTHFMNEIMDRCSYAHLTDSHGNVLRMSKRLDG